jgi:hypothetical protein
MGAITFPHSLPPKTHPKYPYTIYNCLVNLHVLPFLPVPAPHRKNHTKKRPLPMPLRQARQKALSKTRKEGRAPWRAPSRTCRSTNFLTIRRKRLLAESKSGLIGFQITTSCFLSCYKHFSVHLNDGYLFVFSPTPLPPASPIFANSPAFLSPSFFAPLSRRGWEGAPLGGVRLWWSLSFVGFMGLLGFLGTCAFLALLERRTAKWATRGNVASVGVLPVPMGNGQWTRGSASLRGLGELCVRIPAVDP